MIMDKENLYSDAQAVTAAAASDNVIDHGEARDLGTGENLYLVAVLTEAMTDAGSDSTLEAKIQTDDNSGFATPTDAQIVGTFPALSPVGTRLITRLDPLKINERYSRLYFTPANGNLSTGKVKAGIVHGIDNAKAYADAITIS